MKLSPSQHDVVEGFEGVLTTSNLIVLHAQAGLGKTTMLRALHEQFKGAFLSASQFMDASQGRHPLAIEEAYSEMLISALRENEHVFFDDLQLIENVTSCSGFYPRRGMLDTMLTHVCEFAQHNGNKLVFTTENQPLSPLYLRSHSGGVYHFVQDDYKFLCEQFLGERAADLNYDDLYRFAPRLNGHQIRSACTALLRGTKINTDVFIEYLLYYRIVSNVALSDVEHVQLSDLKGVDSTIKALETHVIIPFERGDLIKELNLKPKKGVLLYGPPGTGKTSVGRALAHRLRGKFFLIDGTFISGESEFYKKVNQVFEAAKQNAPSIIFIDDSDVIWEDDRETGLYRYLLTQMDGLENESDGMVCVMMTAMDIGNLPPALVRSGRVELWLEMSLPDEEARREILNRWIASAPPPLSAANVSTIVTATDGLTGADLRRLCEDAKNLYAYDKTQGATETDVTAYYLQAVDEVQRNKAMQLSAQDQNAPHQKSGRGTIAAMLAMEHMSNSKR